MIFLFGGRYAPYVRSAVGIALLVVGLVLHLTAVMLIGVALAIWGLALVATRLRGGQ
ncbi:MAG TPA: hypothetical protein VMR14_00355 [Streptosporangiaceae bacterium]|jgi:heme exporter protein D|nr:hypothetical protein [Streptosporangiaceae bacterium]